MKRRAPGHSSWSTPRRENDIPEFLSGLVGDATCGAPLCAVIRNSDTRSSDYNQLKDIPRPGHADFTAQLKYKGAQDTAGGGHFSGRLTAPLCVAGGICLQFLNKLGVEIGAHIASVGSVRDALFDPVYVDDELLRAVKDADFPTVDSFQGELMVKAIEEARLDGDSLAVIVECAASACRRFGRPMFDGMENRIASAVFGIPSVKGIEFGAGFGAAALRGSENNDGYCSILPASGRIVHTPSKQDKQPRRYLGGITSGMPVFPGGDQTTPSISSRNRA